MKEDVTGEVKQLESEVKELRETLEGYGVEEEATEESLAGEGERFLMREVSPD